MAEGLFLSSGIAGGGARTQDQLLGTAEILRQKFQFKGYIHLKIMPGAEKRELLRIPGIGLKGAEAILSARRIRRLRDLSTLKKFGVIAERTAPYV